MPACPACQNEGVRVFYRVDDVPVHSVLLMPTREEAVGYRRGRLHLAHCPACGFVFNAAFEPSAMEYSSRYEETQGFSETFRTFHRKLARTLDERHQLRGKTVVEIGCGKGEFLSLLCETTGARGIGFDPSYIEERNSSGAKDSIRFIQDFYSEKYAAYTGDLVCCKMTLEHIPDVERFVGTVGAALAGSPQSVVFFQVPDVRRVLRDFAFWDIYYEHCSYFSPGSLARLFRKCGLDPFRVECDYDGQYLMIEARPAGASPAPPLPEERDLTDMEELVRHFQREIGFHLSDWRDFLGRAAARGEKTVLWGGGSKAVAFLSTLGVREEIDFAVDINPYKQNTFLAGSGKKIVGPEFLTEYRPDNVILMNSVYHQEVRKSLAELGLSPQLLTSDSLPISWSTT